MNEMRVPSRRNQDGFTLVEILTVIVIIGILAGLSIPAITAVLARGRTAGIRAEVEGLTQAVEAYKLKYGDYPPDFSSWPIAQAHYRKAFPDIAISELTLLFRMCDDELDGSGAQTDATPGAFVPYAMDRAEALVWSLGGFSSDPQLPFTGTGGPLSLLPTAPAAPLNAVNPAVWQYNTARDNALLDLETNDLTLTSPATNAAISFNNRVQSTDESTIVSPPWPGAVAAPLPDLFPVYRGGGEGSPFVYFDSRTYRLDASVGQLNVYVGVVGDELDMVRPVFDNRINANLPYPSASSTTYGTHTAALNAWEIMSPNTFQILSPGLDGRFGQVVDLDGGLWGDANPVYWQYPTGTMIVANPGADDPQDLIVPNVDKYSVYAILPPTSSAVLESFENDNMANFTKSTFEDDLP